MTWMKNHPYVDVVMQMTNSENQLLKIRDFFWLIRFQSLVFTLDLHFIVIRLFTFQLHNVRSTSLHLNQVSAFVGAILFEEMSGRKLYGYLGQCCTRKKD